MSASCWRCSVDVNGFQVALLENIDTVFADQAHRTDKARSEEEALQGSGSRPKNAQLTRTGSEILYCPWKNSMLSIEANWKL